MIDPEVKPKRYLGLLLVGLMGIISALIVPTPPGGGGTSRRCPQRS